MDALRERDQWLDAAHNGLDERVAELLAQQPNLIDLSDYAKDTALHHAARGGHEKVVARLLAARPDLIHVRNASECTALDIAAAQGDDKLVAQMLATSTSCVDVTTGLFWAVKGGLDKVADLLLNARPGVTSVTETDANAIKILFQLIHKGREQAFTQLLALGPDLIDHVDFESATVLHRVAKLGHNNLIAPILALRPQMVDAVDRDGWTVLMYAVDRAHQKTAERLLAIKPDLIFQNSKQGNTVLHLAVKSGCDSQFVAKLWRMNPQALTLANSHSLTPFHWALAFEKDELIDLFQLSLSFDEIVNVFAHYGVDCLVRCRPVMEQQCELLFEWLSQDVAGTVFEYIGFAPVKRVCSKRHKLNTGDSTLNSFNQKD